MPFQAPVHPISPRVYPMCLVQENISSDWTVWLLSVNRCTVVLFQGDPQISAVKCYMGNFKNKTECAFWLQLQSEAFQHQL